MARTTDDARRGDGQRDGSLVRIGLRIAEWSEKWFPDPLVFALLGVVCVFVIGLLMGEGPAKLATEGGKAFWSLVPFTMQMVMIIIGGYVVASTPIVRRFIDWLAKFPRTPHGAVAWIAMVSMLTSLISWGLSIIFSGLYVRALAKRIAGMDYRAAGAAAYLGLGAVWAMGLSSSAAMMMATKSAIPPTLAKISGVIPLTQTLFIWPSILTTVLLVIASVVVAYCSTRTSRRRRCDRRARFVLRTPQGKEGQNSVKGHPRNYVQFRLFCAIEFLTINQLSCGFRYIASEVDGDGFL